jgi:hypothetical protein
MSFKMTSEQTKKLQRILQPSEVSHIILRRRIEAKVMNNKPPIEAELQSAFRRNLIEARLVQTASIKHDNQRTILFKANGTGENKASAVTEQPTLKLSRNHRLQS